MSRFEMGDGHKLHISDSFYRVISILIFAMVLVLFFIAVDETGRGTVKKQQESLENALSRDIVQCYAIEGRYPPSLEYMEDHYGLIYDKSVFFVDYQPIGSNLYPDVTVILIEGN
ncbi:MULTISPECIES: hypothetical protein [unclassified Butyrivibrio]|uniref:hypothetical protein n=1 Tax=unclassified Butyrivibrio TaxID=2639466 RepID=UPI0003B4200C|nr:MULTISPECIES: hypothetical protein [unclassified Butyrivibrio]MDC7294414.1 hypothetical protein [Butyrivibrio sp. DSM 10294]